MFKEYYCVPVLLFIHTFLKRHLTFACLPSCLSPSLFTSVMHLGLHVAHGIMIKNKTV